MAYDYCTTLISPDCPSQYYKLNYIPPKYHLVLEQNGNGQYRTRTVEEVLE